MKIKLIFDLSMILDSKQFQKVFSSSYNGDDYLDEAGDEYVDLSESHKGMTVFYRDSQYKKRVRISVNTSLLLDDNADDSYKLRKVLNEWIAEYFDAQYRLRDFTLSGMRLITDIDVGTQERAADYLKVLQRIGKVKGFSPISFDLLDDTSFCLEGNSNCIEFALYDLERAILNQRSAMGADHKELKTVSKQTKGILRAEVRLTKSKAILAYTDSARVSEQIVELSEIRQEVFMDTFAKVVPFGDFYKNDKAIELIHRDVKDAVMRRKMLRLLTLIPEKKSLLLAQKTLNYRKINDVMGTFAKINLSPVTISKRHDVKHLGNLYSYFSNQ